MINQSLRPQLAVTLTSTYSVTLECCRPTRAPGLLGHKSHRKISTLVPQNNVRSQPIVLTIDEFSQVTWMMVNK